VISGNQNTTSAPSSPAPAPQQPAPSSGGSGPIDLLNPGRAPAQQVLPGSGNPQGPSRNPVEGLLRGIFGQ
jgi:hypothetical protein